MMYAIKNMDTGAILYFKARTAYEAMQSLVYYLSISDGNARTLTINKTDSNRFLYVVYKGETYCVKMD